jgi:ribosomal protein S7
MKAHQKRGRWGRVAKISPHEAAARLQIARASALTMRVLYLRRLAERLRWLVQQTQESGNVERAKSLAKELAKTKSTLQKAEQEVALAERRSG